jgi:ABC-type Na+ efflux pump permease subunit
VLLGFLLFTTFMDGEGVWRIVMFWVSWFILVLTALANGVSLFVTEREERKWEVLLCTPLSSQEIVSAKLLAGLAGVLPLGGLLGAFWVLSSLAYRGSLHGMVLALSTLALLVLLAYMLGAAASLHARTQRTAFSSSFGLLLGLLFVFPILLLMLQSFAVFTRDQEFVFALIASLNPAPYMAHASSGLSSTHAYGGWEQIQRTREQELWPSFLLYIGIYGTAIGLLAVWMMRRFDRTTGRS